MFFPLLGFALLEQPVTASDRFEAQARAACASPVGTRPGLPGITIEAIGAAGTDLPHLHITDRVSGGSMHAYYDPISEHAAWSRAACLGAQMRLLHAETGAVWRNARWSSVVFTAHADYIPPRSASEKRWTIATAPDGSLTPAAQHMAVVVMPHEQVHAFQKRLGADTPRWFHEGHAQWISRKVVAVLAPEAGREDARQGAQALESSTEPVALARWGGMQVKPEAILRQVGPEEREKIKADPHYAPPGPFSFGPGDMVSDERNTPARYEAAWRVFASLEAAHGTAQVEAWAGELTAAGGSVTPARIQETAQAAFREDLSRRLQ
ncbi:hypothetical protein J2W22_000821 [Sphingomonas kyeonggiensis]|uniref:hypothetical protein n=1 Tax=Sphingomonas kyeonggiensis TaxID=1268553 RepID=UPI00278B7F6B|nr:hypothetical protein [Sphingomonas kyeonggiensis]MDQ0248774.1 hypothetical protein [Sphingomonas kyeonggiensis]